MNFREYETYRGLDVYKIEPLVDKGVIDKGNTGQDTFSITSTQNAKFGKATSDVVEKVNHYMVIQEIAMLTQQRTTIDNEIQWRNNFLADCAKALSTPAEVKA
jgi:hypothetical protein